MEIQQQRTPEVGSCIFIPQGRHVSFWGHLTFDFMVQKLPSDAFPVSWVKAAHKVPAAV